MLGQKPTLARRWLVSVAGRMADMQDRVGDLLAGSLDRQVASWLLREAADEDRGRINRLSVNRQTIQAECQIDRREHQARFKRFKQHSPARLARGSMA